MKNLFKFKERLASGVRRYGRVLSLIVTLTALSNVAWGTTFGIKGNDHYGFPNGMTGMTANGTTFTYSFSAKNGGESWFKLYKDKTENNNNMVSCSSANKFTVGTQYNCKIDGTYYELRVDLTKGVTYTVTVVYTSNSNVKVTISNASTPTTTVPSIRIGKKAVVDGTNVTFNGQIADWGCANVTKVTVYYSTSGNPTKSSSNKEITLSPAIGSNANTGVLNTTGWGSGTYTYALTATNGKGESVLSDFGTFTVQACTPPTLNIPGRDASQTTSMSFNCKATAMGDCTIESWGLKAYTNSACTGDPVATKVATDVLSTSNQKLQLTDLNANTRYYVKLYAVLDGGTTITSEAREWQTKVALETATTTNIVCDGATLNAGSKTGGNCTTVLKEARFRYSTIESDVTDNKKGQTAVTDVTSVGSPFSATLTGLTPNTKYYYRTEITFTAAGSGLEMQTNCPTKNFTTDAASCTAGPAPTFANVVLGQSGTAQNATFTYCGYDNFTYELSGTNAGDFQLGSGTASNGTITLPVTFKPTSTGVGSKTANIIVKSNGTQVATMAISATALCITPTAADYNVTNNTYIYDGQSHTATITPRTDVTYGKYPTGTAQYGGQANQKNVGNYTITYTVSAASGNYCATNFDFDEKLTISKATFPDITDLPTETVILCSGLTEQLTPVCAGATFTYSSDATGVATVSESGLITAVAAGDATITVTATNPNYNDKSATVTVQVKTTPSVTITASPASVGPWEISDITVTPSAGTAAVELWKGGSEVSPTDADVVFEGSGTAYKLKAANKTESSITYTVKATTTSEGCTSAEATKDIPVTKAATEVCQ